MADRLGWFRKESVDIVDLMGHKGEQVRTITAGDGAPPAPEGRELTPLEREMMGDVFELSAEDLEVLQSQVRR